MAGSEWPLMYPNDILPVDGLVQLGVNIKLRGYDSLLLGQSVHVTLPAYALVRDVWKAAMRYDEGALRHYSDRLTGRALLVDRYRNHVLSVWMSDALAVLVGTPMDTVVFIAEPSTMDRLSDVIRSGVHNIFDGTSHRRYRHGSRRRRAHGSRPRTRLR